MPAADVDPQIGVVRSVSALRAWIEGWREAGSSVGFVPTMGALHEGHLSLIRRSTEMANRTVASIFVNPSQFAPHEDFGSYPRREANDLALLRAAGCDLAYIPAREEIYPDGFQTSVTVNLVSQGLCGASRPHFFGGVATVVCKLLNQVRPDYAVFGEKDYQQLHVIRRMVKDLDMTTAIVAAPIVREADGLAMSSRNAYLTADERAVAGQLNRTLADMAARLERGSGVAETIDYGGRLLADAGFNSIDYLEVRSDDLLEPMGPSVITKPSRVFSAVILGRTRLIDNWPVNVTSA